MLRLGDRVLAMWPVEVEWWYPGVVCLVAGNEVEVQFDDGDRSAMTTADVMPLAVGVGWRVFGRWRGDRFYYPGRITEQRGEAIHIDYDDGDSEWTTVSMVRVHQGDLPGRN
jgi:hypothetical protein